jgi:tyramine---L-glutamate ligase
MTFHSTVLVYEFFTGGGCPAGELPASLAAEALGMLWAALEDFHNWGEVRTITALDPRFENRIHGRDRTTLPANEVVNVNTSNHIETYLSLLKRCDAVLVIAPETDGVLQDLIIHAEKAKIPLLGSSSSAAATAGNKAVCGRLFCDAHLPTPATRIADFKTAPLLAKQIGFPLVVKPIDGVGSEGVFRVNFPLELSKALADVCKATSHSEIILQPYINGIHASVSLLAADGRFVPLSLNRQLIESGSFRYQGSQVPYDHKTGGRAIELACSAASRIPGLKGYLGVDLVLTEDGPQLIEINPRFTTSYIALRQVAQCNLARAIWETCIDGNLPDRIPLAGQVTIKKDDPASWGLSPIICGHSLVR